MKKLFNTWLPFAFVATALVGIVYVVAQQVFRQGANDPQIQLAEDWAQQVNDGTLPTQLTLGPVVEPTQSLAPFAIVYDAQGNIVNSSVKTPKAMALPDGVLASVDKFTNHEDRITWQPASGSRFAIVIKRAQGPDAKMYYVLVGRNLLEVEKREDSLVTMVMLGWVATLLGSLFLVYTGGIRD